MLAAVNGYIDGNRVIVEENLDNWQGWEVVVTILDKTRNKRTVSIDNTTKNEKRNFAVMEIFLDEEGEK